MDPDAWAGLLALVYSLKEFAGKEALTAEKVGKAKCSYLKLFSRYSETEIISQWELGSVWSIILLVIVVLTH